MSAIEYSYLLIEISEKLDELRPIHRLLFTCRKYLASGSEENIQDTLSLFKELEEQQNLGIDNLVVIKELLKGVREWSLFGKVKRFENKRKEYNTLLEEIIRVLDELNDLERLVSVCRRELSEESEGLIEDVRSLFKVLENQNILGLDRLDILKEILTETEKKDLLKDVEEFEERRNREDEFERKKAQAAALASSVRNSLTGVVNIKTVFKLFAGGLAIVSVTEVLSGWSSYDQLVAAVQSCVLPAGTRLVQFTDGCVCLTVQAETLSALTDLWKLYRDGTLQKRLYDFFVTNEIKKLAEGEDVEVNVTIEEEEYQKACLELMNEAQGQAAACVTSVAGWIQARSVESVLVLAENLKRAITLVCNFRTVAGGFLTVNSAMALQKCSSRQDYQETFERVVLPSSNKLIEISNGSIRFVVEAEKLAALKELWDIYKDGTLQSRLQEFLVTDEIKQLANGEDIKVTVSIDEHEYKEAYFNLFLLHQAPNVEQEERAGRRPRRNSDSFLCFKPNENEIALKRLMEETEEKWRREKELLELRITELEETLKAERTSNLNQTTTLGRPLERRRRNSDSDLYYKARKREGEQTENEPERAFEDGAEMDFDKRMFVENYSRNIHETHSMTTETSDSGITTHGLTSEIEMQDISDGDRKLCLKDLNEDVIRRLSLTLMSDEAALEQILQSFGIDFPGTSSKMKGGTDIFYMFPDTPVKVLREVFEALQLYDLIDLLEEGKPRISRSLRHALPLQDMERLRNPGDRPMSYHSSVAVLIIDSSETSDTVGIKKFFKGLNTKSEVTVIPYKKYASQNEKEAELKDRIFATKNHLKRKSSIFNTLRAWGEPEENLKEMEKYLKEMEENLKEMEGKSKEMEEMEWAQFRSIISEVIQSWISNQDEFTLFAVFLFLDRPVNRNSPMSSISDDIMERLVTAFPTKGKLVIHPEWSIRARGKKPHKEVVEVSVDFKCDDFPTLMLDIFTKRWQTMDLLSMMRELKRTLGERHLDRRDLYWRHVYRDIPTIQVQENLSCLIRFVMHEEPTNE